MVRAVIFDLDGTLVDTEPLHLAAFNEVLRSRGIEITPEEYFDRLVGYDDHDCIVTVLRGNHLSPSSSEVSALAARKAEVYQGMIGTHDLLYPGAERFVRRCAERFPLMIATGTLRAEAETILKSSGLRDLFLDVIAAEDVDHGKPAPDCFVAARGRMGYLLRFLIHGPECLVVEDTPAGIEAARRDHMNVLAVCHSASEEALSAADFVFRSFDDIDLDRVLRRLSS